MPRCLLDFPQIQGNFHPCPPSAQWCKGVVWFTNLSVGLCAIYFDLKVINIYVFWLFWRNVLFEAIYLLCILLSLFVFGGGCWGGCLMSVYLLTLRTGKSQESHEITRLSWWKCPFLCYTTGRKKTTKMEVYTDHISYHHLTHKPPICLYYKFKLSLQMPTRIKLISVEIPHWNTFTGTPVWWRGFHTSPRECLPICMQIENALRWNLKLHVTRGLRIESVWLVVEPTHMINMLVKLDHFPMNINNIFETTTPEWFKIW